MLKNIPFYSSLLGKQIGKTTTKHSHVLIYGAIEAHSMGEKGCIASNKTIALETGLGEGTVANRISELNQFGWIKVTLNDYNHRTSIVPLLELRVPSLPSEPPFTPELTPLHSQVNIEYSNKNTVIDNSTNVELAKAKKLDSKKPEYGNNEINSLFNKWNEATGYAITSRIKANKRACWNLYLKHGQDGLEKLLNDVKLAHQDDYSPRISDFVDLQAKLNQLSLWIKKGAPTPASTTNTSSSPNKIANINSKISEYLADKFPGNTPIPVNEIYKARSLFI